jgi:phage tail sheath gpL-like
MTGSPKAITVAVALNDSAAVVAQKIREALAADTAVTALFAVGGIGTAVTLTKKTAAANDTSLNIAIANGTCAGLTAAPFSDNTVAGVAPAA